MPIFKKEPFEKIQPFKEANSEDDKKIYASGIKDILSRLKVRLEINTTSETQDKVSINDLDNFDKALEKSSEPLDESRKPTPENLKADIQMHPRLWAMSDRVGKSDVMIGYDVAGNEIKDPTVPQKDPTFYEEIKQNLLAKLKKLSWFNKEDKKAREEINIALDELEQWQQDAVDAYRKRLLNETTESLKQTLTSLTVTPDKQAEKKDLLGRLDEVISLNPKNLETSTASLEQTKKINDLRNDLIKFNEKLEVGKRNPNIDRLATQMSVVGKIWIDPYYSNPKKLTNFEKARQILKVISTSIGAVFALGALIAAFVYPPLIFPLGLISMLGFAPIADTAFEVARNLYYGRTPTKAQAANLGLAIPLMAAANLGIHALTGIGHAVLHQAPKIAKGLINAAAFITNKLANAAGVLSNTRDSFLGSKSIHNFKKTKVEADLNLPNYRVPGLKTLTTLLRHEESEMPGKKELMSAEGEINGKLKKTKPHSLFYMFKNEKGKYDFKENRVKEISNWDKGHFSLFSSSKAKQIKKSTNEYVKLATTDPKTKLDHLKKIEDHIQDWKKEIKEVKQPLNGQSKEIKGTNQPLNGQSIFQLPPAARAVIRIDRKKVAIKKPQAIKKPPSVKKTENLPTKNIQKRSSSRLTYVENLESLIKQERETLEEIAKKSNTVYHFKHKK